MARNTMTLEEINATMLEIQKEIQANLDEFKVIENKFNRRLDLLQKKYSDLYNSLPVTLSNLLETYLPSGRENAEGYKALSMKSAAGEWKGTGLEFRGGYNACNNQRILYVDVDSEFTSEKIESLGSLITEVVESLKPSNLGGRFEKFSKAKIFFIVSPNQADYRLVQMEDGTWSIVNFRCYVQSVVKTGELVALLKYIRETIPSDIREDAEDEYEDEDF